MGWATLSEPVAVYEERFVAVKKSSEEEEPAIEQSRG